MKSSRQLLVIASIATGITLGGKSVHAQQVMTTQTPKPNIYNINEYSTATIKLNDKGDIVKHIQSTLNLYFGAGLAEDGIYGNATEDAVRNIQKKLGVNVDGIFGPRTAKTLLNHIANIANNSVDDMDGFSPVPIKIQKTLISLGYNISANGNLSSYDTKLAIKDFQNKNGLATTGKIDIKMLNKLSEKVKNRTDETSNFKSDTNYYIVANSSDHICRVYKKENEAWKEIKCFDILSGKIGKGTYGTGLQGKDLNFNKVAMKDFTQIDGINVFYSAEKDSGYGLRVSNDGAQLLSRLPLKTTIKIL
jgi:Putative peptidoglycan-binding domain-containing protein